MSGVDRRCPGKGRDARPHARESGMVRESDKGWEDASVKALGRAGVKLQAFAKGK
jgi:hypothetical protein